jgi:hypothetical protein
MWCIEDDLGEWEKELVRQEDTKRVSEQKHAKVS